MTSPNVEQLEVPGADTSPTDTPPRRAKRVRTPRVRTPRKETADRKPRAPRPPRTQPVGPRIAALHSVVGSALAIGTQVPLPLIGTVPQPIGAFGAQLAADADAFGAAWQAYAKANPRVAEALDRLLTVSELGTLLALYGKAAYAGVAATGMVPPLEFVEQTGQQPTADAAA